MENSLLEALLTSIEAGEAVALVTVVRATGTYAPALGHRALVWLEREPAGELGLGGLTAQVLAGARQYLSTRHPQLLTYQEKAGAVDVFVEVQRRAPTLIIVGAGHVAVPLAQLGKLIDFEVVVLDDRPRYANKERFPMADQVLAQPLRSTLRAWPVDNDTFIVLVTRGHSHDVECLLEVLDSPARYIGMIGSKRRVQAVFELLEKEQGIDPTKFERVYSPIGLDIGAENPSEIAIAIIAEIINVYRGGRAVSLSDALRLDRRLPLHPARAGKSNL
jgi:xanthine dehydrogenase accessory factor